MVASAIAHPKSTHARARLVMTRTTVRTTSMNVLPPIASIIPHASMALLISHANVCPATMESIVKMILTNVYRCLVTTAEIVQICWPLIRATARRTMMGRSAIFCARLPVKMYPVAMDRRVLMGTVSHSFIEHRIICIPQQLTIFLV